ncbi:23S rRNA (guanosine-2'-O-)-methyltransferase RlmB [Ephemeroptericola cinctiostellae]|uniref:23S rRNA (Guanosine-2'-O-)-methyltransferase RlmB n=1 Tax=Ephemeroptericola cinctiostellae TaxID=2268024 RepID=A0A345DD26_9BURK|nr:RNA methyltransferase [Ephemeroptericola cinctiostellae]AXF86264.1 23S rRNA (guanosine-2'-O-)-methyltransferase RlmB [Ephemeroptericola cinctiostellae]
MLITSKDNPAVKALKKLLTSPKRSDARMVIEGIHACETFLAHQNPILVWVAESAQMHVEITPLLAQMRAARITVHMLPDALFRDLSTLEQGVSLLFEVERPVCTGFSDTGNAVILDGVQDPGNMGSILRSAAAAGVRTVYLSSACANPFAPKVLRAAVGAHCSLSIFEQVNMTALFVHLQTAGIQTIATSSYVANDLYDLDLNRPVAWVFGNEGTGITQTLIEAAEARAYIPMSSGESLNVAAAAAVCLFEMHRQQR